MRVAHWTDEYPLPCTMRPGHFVQRLVHTMRQIADGQEHQVHLFYTVGTWLFKPFKERYRVAYNALRSGPLEPDLYLHRLLVLPKDIFGSLINPIWQRHILPKIAGDMKCDLIHVHKIYHLAYGAVLAGKALGIPVVLTLRREIEGELRDYPPGRARMVAQVIRAADAVISPSAQLANKCRRVTGRDVRLIPSGTDKVFDEKPSGGLKRQRRVLYVGLLSAIKGVELLVQATLKLFSRGVNFELFIAGEGPLRNKLESLAKGQPRIRFLGQLAPEAVRDQMRQAQIFCMPSYTETLGLVYLEAMKQGLPIIGRRGIGIDGMGKSGQDYELITNDDELLSLLPALLDDAERRLRLAKAGQRLTANWTWENTAAQHIAVYKQFVR